MEVSDHRTLWAVSDLHIAAPGNQSIVDELLWPTHPADWLIVAGDIAERSSSVIAVLAELVSRYEQVIWVPGNHELFSRSADAHRGMDRYRDLVQRCRDIGVLTPEDDYPVFGEHTVVPMFTLYDYSWRDPSTSVSEALHAAEEKGVVFTDEIAIAPYVDIPTWCRDRLSYTVRRLSRITGPTVLINHWPLIRKVTDNLAIPEIALWSGSRDTEEWPQRFRASTVVYGHLHIPLVREFDGVVHAEVSLGYPRERARTLPPRRRRRLWPYPVLTEVTP